MSLLSDIQVGTYLAYVPSGRGLDTETKRNAYRWIPLLKNDRALPSAGSETFDPPMHTTELIAREMAKDLPQDMSELFFPDDATLVPMPRASLPVEGALWVPDRFAHALVRYGLAQSVQRLLVRAEAVTRSSTAGTRARPTPKKHFDTMAVTDILPNTGTIILIDDVLTKGSTALGAASRLKASFPNAEVRCFAAMNACFPDAFEKIRRPQLGVVTLVGFDDTHKDIHDP